MLLVHKSYSIPSLFADQEREMRLDKLVDSSAVLSGYVDFSVMAEEIDSWVSRPGRWHFCDRLVKDKVEHLIFDEVQRQFQLHESNAGEGQIIEAGIVRMPAQHNSADVQAVAKQRVIPLQWTPAQRRQKNVEVKKHGESCFGYKLSVSVDRCHKLIRKFRGGDVSEADPYAWTRCWAGETAAVSAASNYLAGEYISRAKVRRASLSESETGRGIVAWAVHETEFSMPLLTSLR